jgi:hypothetical protein
VKESALFALVAAVIIAILAWVFGLVFVTPGERRAIWISAGVALVVQLVAYGIVRAWRKKNVIAGWGLGTLLRFAVLTIYAFVIVRAFALPSGAALVSLATFFFLSTLVEPLLLKS